MIVKKMPILQGFPDPDTVKFLSSAELKLSEFSPIFYDIETTGLSRYSTFVYLIGAVRYEQNLWILTQWLAESPEEESLIIEEFTRYIQGATSTMETVLTSLISRKGVEGAVFLPLLESFRRLISISRSDRVRLCLNYHE